MKQIKIFPFLAKLILRFIFFDNVFVMCKGYNNDFKNFTELVWEDDKYLDFYNVKEYSEFQLWIFKDWRKKTNYKSFLCKKMSDKRIIWK